MAQTVPSNSFLLTTTPNSRLLVSKKPRQLTVFAKNAGPFSSFRVRKPSGDDDSSSEDEVKKNNRFQFDWSKISDVNVKSLIPIVSNTSGLASKQKDGGTVFVAGATGQAGVRIAQKLLREGFKVRAGVPDLGAAQELARFASDYKIISKEELKRLNAVESTFNDAESIAKAIGNAGKVVVTISSSENGPNQDVSTSDALQVVEAAQLAGVGHLAIIYDDSPTVTTNNVLDGISSFFNNLFSRSQVLTITEFLERVVQTDVRYTLIKTSLTDDFSPESSYNVVVAAEGSAGTNDYKVGMSQMASLVAGIFSNTAVAENKVVQVNTDPSAPLKALEELFSVIPEDGRRKVYAETIAQAKAEEEEEEEEAIKAAEQAREAAEAAKKLEEEVKKLSEQESRATSLAEDAKEKADKAGASFDGFLTKAKDLSSGLSWESFGSQISSAVKNSNIEVPKIQVATVRGQAKARNLAPQKAVAKKSSPKLRTRSKAKEEEKPKEKEAKKEVRNILGGLFKQETIYVDEV